MQKQPTDIEIFLAARFSGNLVPGSTELEKWTEENPAGYQSFENAWDGASRDLFIDDSDTSAAWKKVSQKTLRPIHRIGWKKYRWTAVAASITLLAMISFFLIRTASQMSYAVMNQTGTMAGEQKSIVLPDGTKVKLNSSSTLRYPTEFNDLNREVYLEGEAFFEVVKDQDHPFIIHGTEAEVKVLGTAFNVRTYPADETMVVAVRRGKVAMIPKDANKREVLFLHDMKKGISTQQEDIWQIAEAEEADFAWVDGKLIFNGLSLKEAAERINLMYGSNLVIDSNIEQCRVSCSFQQKGLEEVLKTLGIMLQLDISYTGDQIRLSGKGC